jgi:glycosyltransferase involved in cell wall biosynthesis
MNVLLISYLFHPLTAGGAEQAVLDLARGLSRRGCRVRVLTAGGRDEESELTPGISVCRIFHRSPYLNHPRREGKNILLQTAWRLLAVWNPWIFCKTVAVMRRFRPDVVHVHNFHGFSPAVFSAARLLAIPVVFTPHDFFSICRRYSLYKNGKSCSGHCLACRLWAGWTRLCLGRFRLLSLSRFGRALFLRYLRPGSEVQRCLPSPLDPPEIREAARRKGRLAGKKKTVFLFLGRLNDFKGVRWLLESFPWDLAPQALLLIAGDGPLRPLVEECCARHPAGLRFLGEVSGERKRRLLLATDVLFCLSAAGDMSPLVIPEAFAYGIPVVGSQAGAIPEWVVPGRTGWLVPYGSRTGLAATARDICGQRETVRAFGRNCLQVALANGRDLHAQEVLAYLEETARPGGGGK